MVLRCFQWNQLNPKFQAPTSKLQRSLNNQAPNHAPPSLELGARRVIKLPFTLDNSKAAEGSRTPRRFALFVNHTYFRIYLRARVPAACNSCHASTCDFAGS